jgi:methylated-DNA-[protein]-cysteine S-methyltransferase
MMRKRVEKGRNICSGLQNPDPGVYLVFQTEMGTCAVATRGGRVVRAVLPCASRTAAIAALAMPGTTEAPADPLLNAAAKAISEYFAGKPVDFDLPLDLSDGTPFQQAVWRATSRISRGKMRSYGQIAAAIGNPKAARAVGAAMAANPIPPIVPCHRVIGGDGALCGFMGGREGVELKRKMLRLEGASVRGV